MHLRIITQLLEHRKSNLNFLWLKEAVYFSYLCFLYFKAALAFARFLIEGLE